ncbi:MAG: hypothetical protein V1662_06670 [Candidatus Omnitrophota bacterium]
MRKIEAAIRAGSITVGILLILGIGSADAQSSFLDQLKEQAGSNPSALSNLGSNLGNIGNLGSNLGSVSNLGNIFNRNSSSPLLTSTGTANGLTGITEKLKTSLSNITNKPILGNAAAANKINNTTLPLITGNTGAANSLTQVKEKLSTSVSNITNPALVLGQTGQTESGLGVGESLPNVKTNMAVKLDDIQKKVWIDDPVIPTDPTDPVNPTDSTNPTNPGTGISDNSNLLMYGMLGGMLGGSMVNSAQQKDLSNLESKVAAVEQALYGSSSAGVTSGSSSYGSGYSPYGSSMYMPMMMYPYYGGSGGNNNQYMQMMQVMMMSQMLQQTIQQRQQTQNMESSLEQRVARMEQTMYEQAQESTDDSGILSGVLSTGSGDLDNRVTTLQQDISNCDGSLDNLERRQRAVEIKMGETSSLSSSSSQGIENKLDNLEQRVDETAIKLKVQTAFTSGDGIRGRIDSLSAGIARNEAAAENFDVELAALSLADATVETIQHSFSYVSQAGARTNLNITIWYPAGNGLVDPAQAPYPLIVFAHPCFDNLILQGAQQSSYIAEGLARQGYIVCATAGNKNNAAAAGVYADNSFDARAIINEMLRLNNTANSIFLGTIDAENIGVVGYSLAGGAAETICGAGQEDYTDERVKAVVLLAPVSAISAQEARGIHIPAMFILGADDTKASVNSNKAAYDNIQAAKYMAVVKGTGHLDFTDLGKAKPAAETIVVYTTALFDTYLKVNVNAEQTLQEKHASFLSYSYVLTGAEK